MDQPGVDQLQRRAPGGAPDRRVQPVGRDPHLGRVARHRPMVAQVQLHGVKEPLHDGAGQRPRFAQDWTGQPPGGDEQQRQQVARRFPAPGRSRSASSASASRISAIRRASRSSGRVWISGWASTARICPEIGPTGIERARPASVTAKDQPRVPAASSSRFALPAGSHSRQGEPNAMLAVRQPHLAAPGVEQEAAVRRSRNVHSVSVSSPRTTDTSRSGRAGSRGGRAWSVKSAAGAGKCPFRTRGLFLCWRWNADRGGTDARRRHHRVLAHAEADRQGVPAGRAAGGLRQRRADRRRALLRAVHRDGVVAAAVDLALAEQVVRHPDGEAGRAGEPALSPARGLRLHDLGQVGLSRARLDGDRRATSSTRRRARGTRWSPTRARSR